MEKRKRRSSEQSCGRKLKRAKRNLDLSGSETPDLSGYSSISETEIKKERILQEDDDDIFPLDPNTLLSEIVCHTIHDSDSDTSTEVSNDEENQKRRRKEANSKPVNNFVTYCNIIFLSKHFKGPCVLFAYYLKDLFNVHLLWIMTFSFFLQYFQIEKG